MNERTAIQWIKALQEKTTSPIERDVFQTAIGAMSRNIPALVSNGVESFLYCPRCGSGEYLENDDGSRNTHCGCCGQKLDWSERK